MTAFQPDPDKPTAQQELGGLRPILTEDRVEALGKVGLQIESPRLAAQHGASEYYEKEFALTDWRDAPDDTKAKLHETIEGLRAKTLPGMENDPMRVVVVQEETPEEAGARLRQQVAESWEAFESAHDEGRLF